MAEERITRQRFVPIEKREMRGVALTTILMFAVPIVSIVSFAIDATGKINDNRNMLKSIEVKIEVLNKKIETHSIQHSDCEKWRAVMEEKIKYLTK
ncbi:MAG TPA: hypothetical protein PLS87_11680 [Ferruginibacter sp.]|nr:hypothetical protein [Ferruginibacter sp.]HRO97712.1 hypothetical protein [Ferruginibacter sp.]